MHVEFENHLSARVIEVQFPEGLSISSTDDLNKLKVAWSENLKRWHSPYSCLFYCRKFSVSPEIRPEFEKLIAFFKKFFMKSIIGFCETENAPEWCPFEVIEGYDAAVARTGLSRGAGLQRDLSDLRSRIQIDNDFNAHVMEVSFLAETKLESRADILILRSKVQNILKMWHSPYSILINCSNLTFTPEAKSDFTLFEKFVLSFFCKRVIGYAPKEAKDSYPFHVFRSRHVAAAELEHSGIQSGATANCSTRKKTVEGA